jgi:hypothetical protein
MPQPLILHLVPEFCIEPRRRPQSTSALLSSSLALTFLSQIRAYKKAGTPEGARDDQLLKLGRYVSPFKSDRERWSDVRLEQLVALARLPDFTEVDHQVRWVFLIRGHLAR